PRVALEINLLDRVIAAIDLTEDRGLDRRLRRSRPQPRADQDLFLQPRRAIEPLLLTAISGEVVGQIDVSYFSQSKVVFGDFLREWGGRRERKQKGQRKQKGRRRRR